jgi:hypothetical protein
MRIDVYLYCYTSSVQYSTATTIWICYRCYLCQLSLYYPSTNRQKRLFWTPTVSDIRQREDIFIMHWYIYTNKCSFALLSIINKGIRKRHTQTKKKTTRCEDNYADKRFDLQLPHEDKRAEPAGSCIREFRMFVWR